MPIYQFLCKVCGQSFDVKLKFDEQPQECAHCGSTTDLEQQIVNSTFVLKGRGWYVTDYK